MPAITRRTLRRGPSARAARPRARARRARARGGSCARHPGADEPRLGDLLGRQPAAELRPRRRAQRGRGARGELRRRPSAARPSRPRARRRSRTRRSGRASLGCGASTSRAPAWVARSSAAEPAQRAPPAARAGAAATPRARSSRSAAAARRWPSTWASSAAPPSRRSTNSRSARVEPLAVEVRVEVAEAGREAAAHLPVGARVLAARQPAPAVAQAEQRVELLDQLGRRGAPAHRPDGDGVPAAGSRATSRIGNGMSSRQRR